MLMTIVDFDAKQAAFIVYLRRSFTDSFFSRGLILTLFDVDHC